MSPPENEEKLCQKKKKQFEKSLRLKDEIENNPIADFSMKEIDEE